MQTQLRKHHALVAHLPHLVRLTRWEEHVLFTVPVTLLGAVVAIYRHALPADAPRLVALVLAANLCAVAFAFMVNDLEDAPDDAREPSRRVRNVVACGALARRPAWHGTTAMGILALGLYLPLGVTVSAVGAFILALGFLYSWRGVRLKAWPLVDVLAHVLMLSALLFLAGYVALGGALGEAWLLALGLALFSAYGQFYNQLRDYHADRLAGLRNTASLLGRDGARWAMWSSLAGGGVCMGAALLSGWLPPSLAAAVALTAPLAWLLRSHADMRGTPALDATGRLQNGAMIAVTLALVGWLAWALWGR